MAGTSLCTDFANFAIILPAEVCPELLRVKYENDFITMLRVRVNLLVMRKIIKVLIWLTILILVFFMCSYLLTDPKVTCIEAGGSFDEKNYICLGLNYTGEFIEIVQKEVLFLGVLASVITIVFVEGANNLMDKFYRRRQK